MTEYNHDLMLSQGQPVRLIKEPRLGVGTEKIGDVGIAKFSIGKAAKAFGVFFNPDSGQWAVCYAEEIEFI